MRKEAVVVEQPLVVAVRKDSRGQEEAPVSLAHGHSMRRKGHNYVLKLKGFSAPRALPIHLKGMAHHVVAYRCVQAPPVHQHLVGAVLQLAFYKTQIFGSSAKPHLKGRNVDCLFFNVDCRSAPVTAVV